MRLFFLAPIALGALLLGSACGSTAAPEPTRLASTNLVSDTQSRCFAPDRIINFASSDDTTLNVRTFDRKVFGLETTGACFNLSSSFQIIVRSLAGGTRLCTGDTAEISTPGGTGGNQVCRARVAGPLTEEQVAALPSRARP